MNEFAIWELIGPYLPLGIVGMWRWGMFVVKAVFAFYYRPKTGDFQGTVSIVTPVYNEPWEQFVQALHSWKNNYPYEIIAVIDYTNPECIHAFETFAREFPNAKLIVTYTPGKRPALKEGAEASNGKIIALVDCDTVWSPGFLKNAVAPFADPQIQGVATRQEALSPVKTSEKIQNMFWSYRYNTEMRFLSKAGDALTCLSGRTALYRRNSLLPLLPGLVTETFLGQPVISGDDKYLTEKLQEKGGKTYYQDSALAYTFASRDLFTLIKQQTRWTRNSWRSDIRAMCNGWVWRRPFLAIHLIDRSVAPFTLLIGPIYLGMFLTFGDYLSAVALVGWWMFSRSIKLFPYLKRHPRDIFFILVYVIMTYINAIIRLYTLVTMNRQGWITRWSKERMSQGDRFTRALTSYASYLITAAIIGAFAAGVLILVQSPYMSYFATAAISGAFVALITGVLVLYVIAIS